MEYGTRVRILESKKVHPALWGTEGTYMWTCLPDLIVFVVLDKIAEGAPTGGYGPRFHSVTLEAVEVINEKT
ncbi:MAG: hypothetical protein KAS36_03605 [Anaerolineales bacterium]|nr:hypothetical protein [Anaerolineales bacterium]